MNQEWYCTGKAVAQIVIVFIIFNPRRARRDANLALNRRSSKAIILHDNTLVGAVDQVVTFAGGVVRKETPTSTKPEATLGDKIDLCIFGPLSRQANVFPFPV